MRKDKGFTRFGRGTYDCAICGRHTRHVEGNCNDELCLECFDLAGFENTVFDHGLEKAREMGVALERDDIFGKAVKLGSNPQKIKDAFPELFKV